MVEYPTDEALPIDGQVLPDGGRFIMGGKLEDNQVKKAVETLLEDPDGGR